MHGDTLAGLDWRTAEINAMGQIRCYEAQLDLAGINASARSFR